MRHVGLWYSDWQAVADRVAAAMPLHFVQGDSMIALPAAPLTTYCDDRANVSARILEAPDTTPSTATRQR
ncbi:MAG: hypothetical protein R3D27_13030 [Hyphomicrobiaceae bacterium]